MPPSFVCVMTIRRRDFIRTTLIGSGFVFTSWREALAALAGAPFVSGCGFTHPAPASSKALPAPSTTFSTDTVVVGGGAAGIAATWSLRKSGRDVLLLENEDHVGGVMVNPAPTWKSIPYPLGSTYFARRDNVYGEMLHDFDVTLIETGEDAFYFGSGESVVDPWNPSHISDLPISPDDQKAFRLFRDFVLALPLPTYPVASAAREILSEYDSISALWFVERFKSNVLTTYMDLYSRSVLGAPLSHINAYSFLSFYSVEFGEAFNLPCWTLPGGLGAIAGAAERYLGTDSIHCKAAVVKVENVASGVQVTFVDRETGTVGAVKAKKAIVALPKGLACNMVVGIPDEQARAMSDLQYSPYVTVALCCSAPLFTERAFDFWVYDAKGRFTDIIDVTSSEDALRKFTRSGANVYMVSAPMPSGSLAGMDDSALARHLVSTAQDIAAAVEEHVPSAQGKIEELHVFGWRNSMVVPTVGSYQRILPLISRPVGNIHFAHSDNDIAPGWENAVWWGAQTARTVMGG